MKQFLLEIGTEEIPASFLAPAARELERRVRALLVEHEITAGPAELLYTPRRLALRLSDVPRERPARVVEVQGPPRKAAFDAQGNPTKTAAGFSAAQGLTPADLYVKTTPRGEYVFARKEVAAEPVSAILCAGLAGIIRALPFPKTMRWDTSGTRFARPVRWLLCLLGTEPVGFSLDGLTAGNVTFGHRNSSPPSFALASPADYESALAAHGVIAGHATRRATIEEGLCRLAAQAGGRPVLDEELLEETTDITESPELILCSFQPDYLTLPAEVLITALKKHQRCFSIRRTGSEELLPRFIAVTDTPGCDRKLVGTWYEKAAESRLKDARFFVESDLKLGLEPLVEEEKRVVWIEGMGSYFDKTERLRSLCRYLAACVPGVDAKLLDRAALLSKTDLLTNMVREKEFTSLQGRIGGIYARLLGEPDPVSAAIAGQYLPNFAGDVLPDTIEGALLSIADKTDNIVATFLTGAIPTGSEDPFALRRQATGVLTLVLERGLPVDFAALIETAVALFPEAKPEYSAQLPPFLRERLTALLADKGLRYDVAAAALETCWQEPAQAMARARALAAFRDQPEFERLIVGQKRVANILKKEDASGVPDTALMTDESEKLLWNEAKAVEPDLDRALAGREYDKAFGLLLGMRPTIDRFFDDVLVMDKDPNVRTNRFRLLGYVRSLFGKVADLSKIVIEGENA